MSVSAATASFAPAAASARRGARAVAWWLIAVAGMIFVMVVIGGVTRLTESGLSITHWEPIRGALPPLNAADWQALFDQYRQSPQFRDVFPNLTLAGFKGIFWLEYVHRLWGRLIGIVFLLPFLWFWVRGRIPKGYWPALLGLFVLGGLQGLLGWAMVKSGLVDRPSVSQYRLAAHLALAILIYIAMLWTAFGLLQGRGRAGTLPAGTRRWSHLVFVLIGITVVAGAFVAGLRAGLIYNTFPLMGGTLVPSDYWLHALGWLNPFQNRAAAQFDHRVLATLTLLAILFLWWRAMRGGATAPSRTAAHLLLGAVLLQYALGISTLLLFGRVPPPMPEGVAIGAVHQASALLLVTAAVWFAHAARRPRAAPCRAEAPG